jgi:hypothetical protein
MTIQSSPKPRPSISTTRRMPETNAVSDDGMKTALRDPLDVLAERRHPPHVARHRRADAEELHHQPAADPDDRGRHVHEEKELSPGHVVCLLGIG